MLQERPVDTLRGPSAWIWVFFGLMVGLVLILVLAWWQRRREQEEAVISLPSPSPIPQRSSNLSERQEDQLEEGKIEPEDLKLIEGIGPKIEQLLYEAGIQTYAQLAATEPERLREILRNAGPRFRLADPATWPEQAKLAAEGKWDELRALQASLKGGRRQQR